ncbi:MAG: RlmE family RNA methyltransferase [Desulfatiglandaceae bacterium]
MKGNEWEDHYTRLARKEHWLARSVYKLQEIDQRFKIFRKAQQVLDLGCYPGSWSQYVLKKVGPNGRVVGVDLKVPAGISAAGFRFVQADVLEMDPQGLRHEIGSVDVVMSDLAPKTSGVRSVDSARSMELVRKASELAFCLIPAGGHFLCKVFEGEALKGFRTEISSRFKNMRLFRAGATRKGSREIYLIGQNFLS